VKLPGSVAAYGYDKQGNLVVATDRPEEWGYDWSVTDPTCPYDVVRITQDGQIEDLVPTRGWAW
jgi:YD repeat-containing protein